MPFFFFNQLTQQLTTVWRFLASTDRSGFEMHTAMHSCLLSLYLKHIWLLFERRDTAKGYDSSSIVLQAHIKLNHQNTASIIYAATGVPLKEAYLPIPEIT